MIALVVLAFAVLLLGAAVLGLSMRLRDVAYKLKCHRIWEDTSDCFRVLRQDVDLLAAELKVGFVNTPAYRALRKKEDAA